MEPVWPRIGSEPTNLKEHATYLHEAFTNLKTVKSQVAAIPVNIIDPYIECTLRLPTKVSRHLNDQRETTAITTQLHDIKEELLAQRTENTRKHEAIKSAIQTATAPLRNGNPHATSRVTSWAQVAAKAGPPPGHVTPPDSVLSSRSPLTAYKGREVIVKLLDHAIAESFRQFTPTQLKNKINSILHVTPSVRNVKIAAANQLKSGDVAVVADSIEHATILQTHTKWAKGPRAQVIRTT